MPKLTKSLHTVTAFARVAAHLRASSCFTDAYVLAVAAGDVLGHDIRNSVGDETVQRIVKECTKLLPAQNRKAA